MGGPVRSNGWQWRLRRALVAMWVAAACEGVAAGQQRPLVTEDPMTVGSGQLLVEVGGEGARGISFPASGLRGDLVSGPVVGISVGVGPIAEIQIDGSFYRQLTITERRQAPLSNSLSLDGNTTSAVDDFVIATK